MAIIPPKTPQVPLDSRNHRLKLEKAYKCEVKGYKKASAALVRWKEERDSSDRVVRNLENKWMRLHNETIKLEEAMKIEREIRERDKRNLDEADSAANGHCKRKKMVMQEMALHGYLDENEDQLEG